MKTIIESLDCPNCGAPLDIKQGQEITICMYCNSSVRITALGDGSEKNVLQTEVKPEIINKIKQLLLEVKKNEAIEMYINETSLSREEAEKAVNIIHAGITNRVILERPLSFAGLIYTILFILLLIGSFYTGTILNIDSAIIKILSWIVFAFSLLTLLATIRTFITTIKFISCKWTDARVLKFAKIGETKKIDIYRVLIEILPDKAASFQAQTNLPVRKINASLLVTGIILKVKYLKDRSSVIASMSHLLKK